MFFVPGRTILAWPLCMIVRRPAPFVCRCGPVFDAELIFFTRVVDSVPKTACCRPVVSAYDPASDGYETKRLGLGDCQENVAAPQTTS